MKVQQTVCNKCRAVQKEERGWLQIGVMRLASGPATQLTLGNVTTKEIPNFEVHDLCSAECFHQHIDDLLGMTVMPPPIPETTSSTAHAGGK